MSMSDAGPNVSELSTQIQNQRQAIGQLEKAGQDATSAKIVLDSLRLSLSLAVQNWHLAKSVNSPQKSIFSIVSGVAEANRGFSMRLGSWFASERSSEDESVGPVDVAIQPSLAEGSSETLEFRPLTEQEKKEFLDSLDAEGKQLLAELETKVRGSAQAAA